MLHNKEGVGDAMERCTLAVGPQPGTDTASQAEEAEEAQSTTGAPAAVCAAVHAALSSGCAALAGAQRLPPQLLGLLVRPHRICCPRH